MIFRTFCLACLALGFQAHAAAQSDRPNFLVMLVDDAALMDFGVYGGEAETPNIDALARRGMLFTQHRATPFCAPSRAMLLTGMDNHLAGLGTIPEVLPQEFKGYPGYTMALNPGVETVATKLKRAGYRTYLSGKWHLGSEDGELPIDHGFDRSFLVDASGADNWEDKPYLPYYREAPWFEDGAPADMPEEFYSSTLFVDKLQEYLEADEGADEPFFAYLAFLAVHIPVQAPKAFTDNYVEIYEDGWDPIRLQRWQRAQDLGLVPEGAPLADQPDTIPRWDSLDPEAQQIAAKSLAVNAGMLEAMDVEFGRIIDYLKETGEFENTVFFITSDNGPEAGEPWGSAAQPWFDSMGYHREYDTLGEKGSYVAIGPGGASAMAGPSHLFKFHSSEGGLRVPLIAAGPGVPEGATATAFTTMADIVPTILDMASVGGEAPGAMPMTGKSMMPLLSGEAEFVYGPEEPVGFNTSGQAALYRGDYKLVRTLPPHGDSTWRLFDIVGDPGETTDLSSELPELKRRMMHDYRVYANQVGVLELPEGYVPEDEIARNILARYWRDYWGWAVIALVVFLAMLGGVGFGIYKGVRFLMRKGQTASA
ncbi:MAG: arylsulfatase [Pseudomonadota bacterium]